MNRQHPISAGSEHQDIRVGSTSGSRHTGRRCIQLVETERLLVTLIICGNVPDQDFGAPGAGSFVKDDADS